MFGKKKFDLKAAYGKIGLFKLVVLSDGAHLFNVPVRRIDTYYNGRKVSQEPYNEELMREIIEKETPFKVAEYPPEEFEKAPPNRIILGRLEFGRIGVFE